MTNMHRRLERLEARQGAARGPVYRTPLYLNVFFKGLENLRREEAGEDPLPYTEEEREYQREAAHALLEEYIPGLKGVESSEESRALAAQLEAHCRQRLEELSERS